ncbi:MAG: S8 family serine peptidase [Bacteroidota bacterium]
MKKLRTILWMSILIGLSTSLYAQTVPANVPDSLALVAIYNNTNGPFWNNSWKLEQPVSSWAGVDINGNGQVTALSLAERNIRGVFGGYDIANQLTALQSLDLIDNFVTGFPDGLPASLNSIDISVNRLSFSDVAAVRAAFPNINNLRDTPQKAFGPNLIASAIIGDSVELVVEEDTTPQGNNYLWTRLGVGTAPVIVQRGPSNILRIPAVAFTDSGAYTVQLEHAAAPNFGYQKPVDVRLIVNPEEESHESARDNTGQLRAVLRIPPDKSPAGRDSIRQRLEALGITPIDGESCLCDEFSVYYFPDKFFDKNGDLIVGPVSLLGSACAEVEAVGGGMVQLGYDYLLSGVPAVINGTELNIRMEASLDMTNLAPVKVAVIDLGIDKNHPDLADKFSTDPTKVSCLFEGSTTATQGYNFHANNDNPYDVQSSHGTHVAGIITGFIPDLPIELISVQVGKSGSDTRIFDLVCGIRYAALEEADLINLSMGYTGPKSLLLEDVIKSLSSSPAVTQLIAAAGNDTNEIGKNPFWPAAFAKSYPKSILAVTAMNGPYDDLNAMSNFSIDGIIKIAAPGTNINSTINGKGYGMMSGTSMAAPFLTALLSHPISVNKAISPGVITEINLDAASKNPNYSLVENNILLKVNEGRKLRVLIDDCNDVPLARDDKFSVANGQNLTFEVRANDCPATGLVPSIASNIDAADGQLTVNADGTISFAPTASATDKILSFSYQLCSAGAVCSEAEVNINIGGDNPTTGNYWWWILLILLIMILLAYFVLRRP